MRLLFALLVAFLVSACPSEADVQQAPDDCVPTEAPDDPMPATPSAYAALCAEHLGTVPTVDCGEGVRVPIRVDGVEVFEDPGAGACDDTDFKGGCPVGSTIGRLEGTAADGSPLSDVVWVFFCRSQGVGALDEGVASVQMIGHHQRTGATCFFESPDAEGDPIQASYLETDEDGVLTGRLPGPDDLDFDDAWLVPPVECVQCHQNDPFLHTRWIDGARMPGSPAEPVLPEVAGPASPYWVVGGADWDMRTVHIEGNQCVSCHRAPMATAALLEFSGQDVNDWMPPDAPGSLAADARALRECHDWGGGPNCSFVEPPVCAP